MKKLLKSMMLALLFVPMASLLVACNEKPHTPVENTEYSVTANESDYYDVTGQTTKATAGVNAYVKIVPEFDAVVIDKVLYNGQECVKSDTEEDKYTFTMPSENVTITVEYSFQDNTTDNFLSWSNDNEDTFTVFVESPDDSYSAQWDDGTLTADVTKTPSQSGPYFTSHTEEVFSTNQNVVPDSALSVDTQYKSNTNSAVAFEVHIDRTRISEGETQIVLLVNNGHKFGDASLLVCTITVVNAQN